MVIEEDYDPLLVQEVMSFFFGIGTSDVEPATKQEQETFLDLLENPNGECLGMDFLNCWLSGRGLKSIPDKLLNSVKKSVILKKKKRPKRRKK